MTQETVEILRQVNTADEAEKIVLAAGADSCSRMDKCIILMRVLPKREALKLLGRVWPFCDTIGLYRRHLHEWLNDTANLDAMMTPTAIKRLSSLPRLFTVWRGCYRINSNGYSWSLKKDIAAQFPNLHRYKRPGEKPLLLQGTANRDASALILCRKEEEVVSAQVSIVSAREL